MCTRKVSLGVIGAVSVATIVGWNASGWAGTVTIDFSHTPGDDGILGTDDDVPIENIFGTGGELTGDEFGSVGILFSTTGLQLNIGCGTFPGDPFNCLGADEFLDDDFEGLLIGEFTLGGGPATVAALFLDVVNDENGSFTTLFDIEGAVIATFFNDVHYTGPTPVARYQTALRYDGHLMVQYSGLVPGPGGFALIALTGLTRRRRRRT